MADSVKIKLPFIEEGQVRAEISYNESMILTDFSVFPKAKDFDPAPPASPNNGDAYVVSASGASGAWIGKENNYALYQDGWRFIAPVEGMTIYVTDEANFWVYRTISASPAWRKAGPVTDVASVGTTYSQSEVNAIVTTLNSLMAQLRTIGHLKT